MENELDKTAFFRFEDLRIYIKALDYTHWVFQQCYAHSRNSTLVFCDAFYQTTISISTKIAEGSSLNKPQFIQYLKQAKSAVRECVVYTTLAHKQGLFSDTQMEESRSQLMEMTKMLGALIGSLQRSAGILDGEE